MDDFATFWDEKTINRFKHFDEKLTNQRLKLWFEGGLVEKLDIYLKFIAHVEYPRVPGV